MYTTDKGDISVQVKQRAKYELEVKIPTNMTAQVYIPKGKKEDHVFTWNGKRSTGSVEGEYIFVGELGSGKHHIKR